LAIDGTQQEKQAVQCIMNSISNRTHLISGK